MNPAKIISFGEVLWDLFPEGSRFGGAPANLACHAAILGAEVTVVSAVGDDERGREAVRILEGYRVDTGLIQIVPGAPTGTVGVALDAAGKPQFTIHEETAWDETAWTPDLAARIAVADAVYFGTLGQRSETSRTTIRRALEAAKAPGVTRLLDVNLRAPFFDVPMIRESIALANVLKISDDELPEVARACALHGEGGDDALLRRLLEQFQLDLVVMTRGAKGALLVSPGGEVNQPGIPAEVVDTVGAGDSFTAAFLVGLLRGEPYGRILQAACERAARVCAMRGAVPENLDS